MSGGQRKRVTFADLVTARLPATSQQPPATQLPEPGPEGAAAPGPAASPLADNPRNLEETATDDSTAIPGAELQLITSVNSSTEQPQEVFLRLSGDDSLKKASS